MEINIQVGLCACKHNLVNTRPSRTGGSHREMQSPWLKHHGCIESGTTGPINKTRARTQILRNWKHGRKTTIETAAIEKKKGVNKVSHSQEYTGWGRLQQILNFDTVLVGRAPPPPLASPRWTRRFTTGSSLSLSGSDLCSLHPSYLRGVFFLLLNWRTRLNWMGRMRARLAWRTGMTWRARPAGRPDSLHLSCYDSAFRVFMEMLKRRAIEQMGRAGGEHMCVARGGQKNEEVVFRWKGSSFGLVTREQGGGLAGGGCSSATCGRDKDLQWNQEERVLAGRRNTQKYLQLGLFFLPITIK